MSGGGGGEGALEGGGGGLLSLIIFIKDKLISKLHVFVKTNIKNMTLAHIYGKK